MSTVDEMREHASGEHRVGHTSAAKCIARWASELEANQKRIAELEAQLAARPKTQADEVYEALNRRLAARPKE